MNDPAYTPSGPMEERTLISRYTQLFVIAVAVVAADQIVKRIVAAELKNGRLVDLAGGLLRLDYTRNAGAAFGFYQGRSVLLGVVAVAICAGIVVYFRRLAMSPPVVRAALGLILGGAIGNLLDRIRLGYVVDFIDLRWWPVFNLADSAIVIGVALLVGHSLLQGGDDH